MKYKDSGKLTLNEYQELSRRPLNWKAEWEVQSPGTTDRALANMCMGLAGEAGEVVDLLKKHLFHGHPLDKEKVREEVGDVLFYLAGLCTILGIPLSTAGESNVRKLEKRYPEGFSVERSIHREQNTK